MEMDRHRGRQLKPLSWSRWELEVEKKTETMTQSCLFIPRLNFFLLENIQAGQSSTPSGQLLPSPSFPRWHLAGGAGFAVLGNKDEYTQPFQAGPCHGVHRHLDYNYLRGAQSSLSSVTSGMLRGYS